MLGKTGRRKILLGKSHVTDLAEHGEEERRQQVCRVLRAMAVFSQLLSLC